MQGFLFAASIMESCVLVFPVILLKVCSAFQKGLTVRDCAFPDNHDKTIPAVLERSRVLGRKLLFCASLGFKYDDIYLAVLFNWFLLNSCYHNVQFQ